jgi:DNA-binding beta-propeller fold protein YncE
MRRILSLTRSFPPGSIGVMNRFTRLSAAGLALALLLPSAAQGKPRKHPTSTPTATATSTPTPMPVLDSNGAQLLYALDHAWGSRGSSLYQLNSPEGVFVSPAGDIAIADTGNHRIVVWDANGKPLRTFGAWGSSAVWNNAPQFNLPGGVLIHPSGKYLVADTLNHRVVMVDQRGLVVSTWGRRGTGDGEFDMPRCFALGKYGDVWVLDTGNSRLQAFSALGDFKSRWGDYGTEIGQLKYPLGMALNAIEQFQVADTQNFRYQVFNSDGTPVTVQGWMGEGPNQFLEPSGLAVTPSGMIAISDGPSGRVLFYNNRFEYVGDWKATADPAWKGPAPDLRGIASDAESRLAVTDRANSQLIRLRPLSKINVAAPRLLTPLPNQENLYGGSGFPVR